MPDQEIVFRRVRSMGDDEKLAEDGKIRLLASTSEAVDWGGWREVLAHNDGAVDMSAARSLLVNHDPDQLAGGISGMSCDGRVLTSDAEIDEDARMRSGVSVRRSVAKRRLNGVSIGYTYRREDTEYDEQTRTLTVKRWRLLEISLTPIPADARAQVRSLPFDVNPAAVAAHQKERHMPDPVIKPQDNPPAAPVTQPDAGNEAQRAAVIAEQRAIAEQAKSLGLDAGDYVGMKRDEARDAMMLALARKAKAPAPELPVTPTPARIDYDALDKARDAFTGALAHRAAVSSPKLDALKKDNPLIGSGLRHAILEFAQLCGIETRGWSEKDVAGYAMNKPEMLSERAQRAMARAGSNVATGQFGTFVFLNAITKIIARGFESGSASAKYRQIVAEQTVPDFKQFSIGSLSAGNLEKTAELAVFPELAKAEGVYNSAASMWGGTLSLSLQALVSDDTASFERLLRMAGPIADKTIDRRVFQKLLMGTSASEATATWTNNTTSGGSLVYTTADLMAAARGKLGLVRTAFMNKVGKDGNPYGNVPRFLVVPVTREVEAQAIVGGSGPGLQAGVAQPTLQSLIVVASPWLEASALTGNSTTSYYLLGDPNEVTALVLSKVRGFENIQVTPYDAGAVAGFNYKLWLPFEADLVYDLVSGTKYFPGAQQGTT